MASTAPPVFRFAPSPNGALHLGHAYSAIVNQQICERLGGVYLIRLEDIDQTRCTPELESQMLEDLVANLQNHAETGQIPKPYR